MEEAIKPITEENTEFNDTSLPNPNGSQKGLQETITTKQEDLNSQPTKKLLDLFEEALEKNETYQSGFWNGYFELSKDSFEAYLSQKNNSQ
jgi:hypothetical protein